MFKGLLNFVAAAGDLGIFGAKATHELFRPPFESGEWSRQVLDLGSRSVPLIVVAGLALGVVMAMDARGSLSRFGGQGLVPAAVGIGMFRVLGPLVTGLLISGRVGAGIGAQLGGMRVTEQIDALEALAVDSFKYLVVTRVLACIVAMPILTVLMDFSGLVGGLFLEMADRAHVDGVLHERCILGIELERLPAHRSEDHGFRADHRGRLLLPRLQRARRSHRRGEGIHEKRGFLLDTGQSSWDGISLLILA